MARKKKTKEDIANLIRQTADDLSDTDSMSTILGDELDVIADSVSVNGVERAIEETEMKNRWVTEDLRKDKDNPSLRGRSAAYTSALEIMTK